jgi:hypothetical protein
MQHARAAAPQRLAQRCGGSFTEPSCAPSASPGSQRPDPCRCATHQGCTTRLASPKPPSSSSRSSSDLHCHQDVIMSLSFPPHTDHCPLSLAPQQELVVFMKPARVVAKPLMLACFALQSRACLRRHGQVLRLLAACYGARADLAGGVAASSPGPRTSSAMASSASASSLLAKPKSGGHTCSSVSSPCAHMPAPVSSPASPCAHMPAPLSSPASSVSSPCAHMPAPVSSPAFPCAHMPASNHNPGLSVNGRPSMRRPVLSAKQCVRMQHARQAPVAA